MTAQVQEFTISRTFDAPRELVWKLWTVPEQMAKWWGPKGFTVGKYKMDFRNGGSYLYSLIAPDGKILWGRFEYLDIRPQEKIHLINYFSDENGGVARHPMNPNWPLKLLSTFSFAEKDGKTAVTVQWTPYEASDIEIRTFEEGRESMKMGWGGTLDQLGEYVASINPSRKSA